MSQIEIPCVSTIDVQGLSHYYILFHSVTFIQQMLQMTLLPFLACQMWSPTTFYFLVVMSIDLSHSGEEVLQGANKDIIKEKPHPNHIPSGSSGNSDPHPTYIWTKSGQTECSTTCGTGDETNIIQRKII